MSALTPLGVPAGDLSRTIDTYESVMLAKAHEMGLPSDGVLVEVGRRVTVLNNLDDALAQLPAEKRATSMYLSKFMFAVGAGLFDAALNYLWDETITELRKRIVNYDLSYFFDLAVTSPEKRKDLKDPEDLAKITDDELIRAAAAIGFISQLGQAQLDLVRHMRNHASAAHPNQHELGSFALLSFAETCVKEVIMLPESPTMVATSRLLANVKQATVSAEEAASFAPLFAGLRRDQTDALANGLFGIYVSNTSAPQHRDNVRELLTYLWPHVAPEVRANFGVRYARYKANLDQTQAAFAREFLDAVGGSAYLPDDIRISELDGLIDQLARVHDGWDNFYHEPPVARKIQDFIGDQPVPLGVREKYIRVLTTVYLGRRSGIALAAMPTYQALIRNFTPDEAALALLEVTGPNHSAILSFDTPQLHFTEYFDMLRPKLIGIPAIALRDLVSSFTGPKEKFYLDAQIAKARGVLTSHLS